MMKSFWIGRKLFALGRIFNPGCPPTTDYKPGSIRTVRLGRGGEYGLLVLDCARMERELGGGE
jgi:hypothetical protein